MNSISDRKWHMIDMKGAVYGRALSNAASLLVGKNKPQYKPNIDMGDYVVIINANDVKITGDKLNQKIYYKHTGYLGNMKKSSLKDDLAASPEKAIKRSIKGMLPKNKLAKARIDRLKVYEGSSHPHQNIKFEESHE